MTPLTQHVDERAEYPAPMALDVPAVERELCRIPEVRAARIVTDGVGKPIEVHVLATPTKHAKQIVRDVQSVAMATIGLEIDHRIVSVVQLDDPDTGGNGSSAAVAETTAGRNGAMAIAPPAVTDRILVDSVVIARRGVTCTATVSLLRGEETASASIDGPVAASVTPRLVARATLEALRVFQPAAVCAEVETAALTRMGDREVAVTTIVLAVPPHEDVVSGSAPVRSGGEHDAIARAVLDATNRRLDQLT